MQLARLLRHIAATHWRTRVKFPAHTLDAIEAAVSRSEREHAGEIRFVVETSMTPAHILAEVTPRARALELFSQLRVWDTEGNNGVLIYVQMADRSVEIVADRGVVRRVAQADWDGVCRMMEEHFRAGRFEAGSVAGVEAVAGLLARHFPSAAVQGSATGNQLPDRPTLL